MRRLFSELLRELANCHSEARCSPSRVPGNPDFGLLGWDESAPLLQKGSALGCVLPQTVIPSEATRHLRWRAARALLFQNKKRMHSLEALNASVEVCSDKLSSSLRTCLCCC